MAATAPAIQTARMAASEDQEPEEAGGGPEGGGPEGPAKSVEVAVGGEDAAGADQAVGLDSEGEEGGAVDQGERAEEGADGNSTGNESVYSSHHLAGTTIKRKPDSPKPARFSFVTESTLCVPFASGLYRRYEKTPGWCGLSKKRSAIRRSPFLSVCRLLLGMNDDTSTAKSGSG